MADTYGGNSGETNALLAEDLPDQWIQIKINFAAGTVFNPAIHVEYEFDGEGPIQRDCASPSGHSDIDVVDTWVSTGVTVDGTHIDLDAGAKSFTLACGKKVTATYTTTMSPVVPPPPPARQKKVLWLVITPAL
jgi:hypothetical protein